MIYRTVNLNPNYGKWDDNTRKHLLSSWRSHYYENNINMSPIEGYPQGGQGYFDSQMYFSSLDYTSLKNISPSDDAHPVNIAFKKRQEDLEIEFNKSSPADRERLSNLMEVEKDSHEFWQKNELFSKVLGEDDHGNPYPKELVDEIRSEKDLAQENFRCSMEDLINYDAAYHHPLSNPNRDFKASPVTDKEREIWCNRKSIQGIKREYLDENGINLENKILKEKENISHSAYWGNINSGSDINRIPQSAQDFYDKYNPTFRHNNGKHIDSGLYSNQKENRIEGLKVNEIEEKIKKHNINNKEIENTITNIENSSTIEQRDERINAAQEKVKEVIPANKEFKAMPEINEEKGMFSSWIDKTKEKVSDFKEKALILWEERVAPKLGIETEKSRKEAYQESIDKINLKEIRDFEKKIKAEEENSIKNKEIKHKPRGESEIDRSMNQSNKKNNKLDISENKDSLNQEKYQEDVSIKKRRPSAGMNDDESPHKNNINNDTNDIKHKPTGESSKPEHIEIKIDEDKFSRKMR